MRAPSILYPTKALARDQEAGLRELIVSAGLTESGHAASAVVYDGDTPGDARRAARERSGIVLTNPDMLHAGILPHHAGWSRLFANLKYVVIDELHTYRGVFGSHLANVIARLRPCRAFPRLSTPVLICATATIGNPREHAARLSAVTPTSRSSTESGAPGRRAAFFLFNPPVVNAELGIRASYLKSAVMLAADLVRAGVPTIVFGQSRNSVEVMLKYLRDEGRADVVGPTRSWPTEAATCPRSAAPSRPACATARSSAWSPPTRSSSASTSAISTRSCARATPGSMAAMWQRFGRAGRRGGESIACS